MALKVIKRLDAVGSTLNYNVHALGCTFIKNLVSSVRHVDFEVFLASLTLFPRFHTVLWVLLKN